MSSEVPTQLRSAARTALNLFLWIAAILVLIYLLSGIYSVANNEVAVHQRFGRIVNAHVEPGIHFALPWPIDSISKVPTRVDSETILDFSQNFTLDREGTITFSTLTGLGTYVITADNNLVNLECVIQYEVVDPRDYLFNLGEATEDTAGGVKRFLIEMTCTTLIHCFARRGVDEALTSWEPIVAYVKKELQDRLNEIGSGLAVTFVEIRALKPPARVQEFFNDVINAKIDMQKAINDAESYQNEEIPAAEGRAARLRASAEGIRAEVEEKARGEADRFLSILDEYQKSPDLTRYRLYMETIREILVTVENSYIVDTARTGAATLKLLK